MRIALLTYSTKPRGGVVHTLALAEALARGGADVTVWSLGRGGDNAFFRTVDSAVGVRIVPFAAIEGESVGDRILRSIAVLREAFTPADYDIVHAQDCISANAVGPCIRTIHHLDQFTTPALAACHERAIVDPYARICVSQAVAQEVRAGWGFEPTVIANGVDAARFETAVADVAGRRRWAEMIGGDYVLAVGGIEPRKGSIDLVEAFALLQRTRPDLHLVFAGGETLFDYRSYRDEFDARCAELGVYPTILGTVDNDALPALVAQATVFAFLSIKEGFGLAAMEALAADVPVVARDLPVLREIFDGAVRFASTREEMAEALGAPGVNLVRSRGRMLARTHSWDNAAREHLDFYRTCAGMG